MNKLIVDLETLPDCSPDAKERAIANLKPPANYTKPESIAKWMEENAEEAWRKTSFEGGRGSICVIGYAIDESPAQAIICDNEAHALNEFFTIVAQLNLTTWIGHNILAFDLPFLWKRAVIHGHEFRRHIPKDARHGQDKVFDTMLAWAGFRGTVSQKNLASMLNIKVEDDFDGSMVYDAWKAGKKDKVVAHCLSDIETVREIYRRLT